MRGSPSMYFDHGSPMWTRKNIQAMHSMKACAVEAFCPDSCRQFENELSRMVINTVVLGRRNYLPLYDFFHAVEHGDFEGGDLPLNFWNDPQIFEPLSSLLRGGYFHGGQHLEIWANELLKPHFEQLLQDPEQETFLVLTPIMKSLIKKGTLAGQGLGRRDIELVATSGIIGVLDSKGYIRLMKDSKSLLDEIKGSVDARMESLLRTVKTIEMAVYGNLVRPRNDSGSTCTGAATGSPPDNDTSDSNAEENRIDPKKVARNSLLSGLEDLSLHNITRTLVTLFSPPNSAGINSFDTSHEMESQERVKERMEQRAVSMVRLKDRLQYTDDFEMEMDDDISVKVTFEDDPNSTDKLRTIAITNMLDPNTNSVVTDNIRSSNSFENFSTPTASPSAFSTVKHQPIRTHPHNPPFSTTTVRMAPNASSHTCGHETIPSKSIQATEIDIPSQLAVKIASLELEASGQTVKDTKALANEIKKFGRKRGGHLRGCRCVTCWSAVTDTCPGHPPSSATSFKSSVAKKAAPRPAPGTSAQTQFVVPKNSELAQVDAVKDNEFGEAHLEIPMDPMVSLIVTEMKKRFALNVSTEYANDLLLDCDNKLVPTMYAIKQDLSDREDGLRRSGRFEFHSLKQLAKDTLYDLDNTDGHPLDHLLDFLEYDDEKLHEVVEKGWESTYGRVASEERGLDGNKFSREQKQKRFKMILQKAYSREWRGEYCEEITPSLLSGEITGVQFDNKLKEMDIQIAKKLVDYEWDDILSQIPDVPDKATKQTTSQIDPITETIAAIEQEADKAAQAVKVSIFRTAHTGLVAKCKNILRRCKCLTDKYSEFKSIELQFAQDVKKLSTKVPKTQEEMLNMIQAVGQFDFMMDMFESQAFGFPCPLPRYESIPVEGATGRRLDVPVLSQPLLTQGHRNKKATKSKRDPKTDSTTKTQFKGKGLAQAVDTTTAPLDNFEFTGVLVSDPDGVKKPDWDNLKHTEVDDAIFIGAPQKMDVEIVHARDQIMPQGHPKAGGSAPKVAESTKSKSKDKAITMASVAMPSEQTKLNSKGKVVATASSSKVTELAEVDSKDAEVDNAQTSAPETVEAGPSSGKAKKKNKKKKKPVEPAETAGFAGSAGSANASGVTNDPNGDMLFNMMGSNRSRVYELMIRHKLVGCHPDDKHDTGHEEHKEDKKGEKK